MSKKNKNSRKNTYVVINLITEYGCPLNGCKYAIASPLNEEQLKKEYASELSGYEPFIYMTNEMAQPILESNRNIRRWNKAHVRKENFYGYVDGFTNGKNPEENTSIKDPAEILIEREEEEEKRNLTNRINRALSSLTESQRRRLNMRYFDEKTMKEIAQEEGVAITTVQDALERALASLRKAVIDGKEN